MGFNDLMYWRNRAEILILIFFREVLINKFSIYN
jgi:hypothetical protein